MTEANTVISQILKNLEKQPDHEIDKIKEQLRPLIDKIDVETVTIPAGTFLYRAIKIGNGFSKKAKFKPSDLQHRKAKEVKMCRVNRERQPMLYCSLSKEPPFFEIELFNNDELVMGFWQISNSITLINIGYTKSVFEKYKANRSHNVWRVAQEPGSSTTKITHDANYSYDADEIDMINNDKDREIKEAISAAFMQEVGSNQEYKYKLTIAIAELSVEKYQHFSGKISGVMYPSSKMRANGDNVALNIASNLSLYDEIGLKFKKAMFLKIDNISKNDQAITFNELDQSLFDSKNHNISWLGHTANWKIPPGHKRRVVLEPVIDKNGDYKYSMDGTRCNWVMYDESGVIFEPS